MAGVFFRSESFAPVQILGAAVVLLGVWGVGQGMGNGSRVIRVKEIPEATLAGDWQIWNRTFVLIHGGVGCDIKKTTPAWNGLLTLLGRGTPCPAVFLHGRSDRF